MSNIKDKKNRFFISWTLWSAILLPAGAVLGFIAILAVHEFVLGYDYEQIGPPYIQTFEYCIWAAIMGAVVGLAQWLLLRKWIRVSSYWILSCVGGLVFGEILAGVILWKLGIDRGDLGFAQGGSILAEALIFVLSGALVGLLQYPLIKKNYRKAGLWIIACCLGWGLIPVAIIFFGGIVLGGITGTMLIWILQPRD